MEEEDDKMCDIFESEKMISTLQTFTRFASPNPERGAVMVVWPREQGLGYKPHPEVRDSWDDRHVRMPFSKVIYLSGVSKLSIEVPHNHCRKRYMTVIFHTECNMP